MDCYEPQKVMHLYEIRPRKDRRGFDLISDVVAIRSHLLDARAEYKSVPARLYSPREKSRRLSALRKKTTAKQCLGSD
jgi:hypothetical protein